MPELVELSGAVRWHLQKTGMVSLKLSNDRLQRRLAVDSVPGRMPFGCGYRDLGRVPQPVAATISGADPATASLGCGLDLLRTPLHRRRAA
jgi:hypothetical protein